MGWSLTDVEEFHFRGERARVHADGNNAAWTCPCGHGVLLIYQQGRAGSHPDRPSVCEGCRKRYTLEPAYVPGAEPPAGDVQAPAERMEVVEVP